MSKYTIQDIFITYGEESVENHKLSDEQWKVFNAIRNCGTSHLGYHICTCEECGEEYFGYNSCRNRHCPMCQNGNSGFKKSLVIYLILDTFTL